MKIFNPKYSNRGFALPTLLSFMIAMIIIATSVVILIDSNSNIVSNNIDSQKAFNIAEAGVNYYLWHLSHNGNDYKDGQSTPATPDPNLGYGPYTHNYVDDNAKTQGTYTLWIKPQGSGSTIVTVRSIGKTSGTNIIRTVETKVGATSFAGYAILSDSALWFGNTEEADGPVHSNQGIRMDGSSNNIISSANATYTPSTQIGGDGSSHPGVWCSTSITSPINCNTRNKDDWHYPVTAVDFNQVNGTLCTIKKTAFTEDSSTASLANQSNACSQTPSTRTAGYLPQRSSSSNNSRGYLINLKTNGTYDLYTVNNVNDTKSGYADALNESLVASGISVPSGGIIFAEDNVWVRSSPTYHGRVTIASGRLATSVSTSITVADNLAYSTKDGSDAIGLIAEDSVYIAPFAPPASGSFTLEVDAAVLAANGDVEYPSRYTFASTTCSQGWINSNQKLNFYGSIAVRQTWTWSWLWSSSCGDNVYDSSLGSYISGFKNNSTQYDYNLLYAPPPGFPITGSYNILSWREVLTHP
jgi:Tfp pilus assembly protein PilX